MDIIEMAKRAGFAIHTARGSVRVEGLPSDLERLAQEVRSIEREECAKVCDRFQERQMQPAECAAAIRRGT